MPDVEVEEETKAWGEVERLRVQNTSGRTEAPVVEQGEPNCDGRQWGQQRNREGRCAATVSKPTSWGRSAQGTCPWKHANYHARRANEPHATPVPVQNQRGDSRLASSTTVQNREQF